MKPQFLGSITADQLEHLTKEAEIAAAEVDAHMTDAERERFIERYISEHQPNGGSS